MKLYSLAFRKDWKYIVVASNMPDALEAARLEYATGSWDEGEDPRHTFDTKQVLAIKEIHCRDYLLIADDMDKIHERFNLACEDYDKVNQLGKTYANITFNDKQQ